MKLEDYKLRLEKQKKWDEEHYIQAFIRDTYYFLFWGIPRRIGDAKRTIKFGFQRMFRGYDDTAYWGLNDYIIDIALPVLKWYRINKTGFPIIHWDEKTSHEEQLKAWNDILDKIILGFQDYKDEGYLVGRWENVLEMPDEQRKELQDDHEKIVTEALTLFAKHFRGLWD